MFDRSLVSSGFDIELLVSEEYLSYVLLAQFEAGILPAEIHLEDPEGDLDTTVTIHPPPPIDYQLLDDYQRDDQAVPLPQSLFDSFKVNLLDEGEDAFFEVGLRLTIENHITGEVSEPPANAYFRFNLALEAETNCLGLEERHELRFSFVGLGDLAKQLIESQDQDVDKIEKAIRERVDRAIGLPPSNGNQVQRVRLRKFVNGDRRALGLYIDLALRSGPEMDKYLDPRGDISLAQNFLAEHRWIAFATSPGLFDLLGPNLKYRAARETEPGSGDYRYNLTKKGFNPSGKTIGRLNDVSVGPMLSPQTGQPTGRLQVDLKGVYTGDIPVLPEVIEPDVKFTASAYLNPAVKDGLVDWELDISVDAGLLGTLLSLTGFLFFGLIFGAGGPALSTTSLIFLETVGEPALAEYIEQRVDNEDLSFLDAIPFKLQASSRRWDPFYQTNYLVAAIIDDVVIDELGIAFEGVDNSNEEVDTGAKLGKERAMIKNLVVRDEVRDDGEVTRLRYRVKNIDRIKEDLVANGPGLDRMSFEWDDPEFEPELFSLSEDEIFERASTGQLLGPIEYRPSAIHVDGNQIDQFLCISLIEERELRQDLVREFRRNERNEIVADDGDAIRAEAEADLEAELGQTPTPEEVECEFRSRVDIKVDEALKDYRKEKLDEDYSAAILEALRFDLAPEEFVHFQRKGILRLVREEGLEIVVRTDTAGNETPYYRDPADTDTEDNLLALPRYIPPYEPPT